MSFYLLSVHKFVANDEDLPIYEATILKLKERSWRKALNKSYNALINVIPTFTTLPSHQRARPASGPRTKQPAANDTESAIHG